MQVQHSWGEETASSSVPPSLSLLPHRIKGLAYLQASSQFLPLRNAELGAAAAGQFVLRTHPRFNQKFFSAGRLKQRIALNVADKNFSAEQKRYLNGDSQSITLFDLTKPAYQGVGRRSSPTVLSIS